MRVCCGKLVRMLSDFDARERKILRRLNTPLKIQQFLDQEIRYNKEHEGDTCYSPRMVLRQRTAHCLEGAMLAAAALEFHGRAPLIVDMEAVRDDDHVIAVYRVDGGWGAVAKSNYSGLRYRSAVYRTVRELAISYFDDYYNDSGEATLRSYSRPVSLHRFDLLGWRTAEKYLWEIPKHLFRVRHFPLLGDPAARRRYYIDKRKYDAGLLGAIH
jgi:hypothetical protein